MADTLDDLAFWLPTQILNDEDPPAMELNSNTKKSGGFGLRFDADAPKALLPFEFPYGGAFGVSSDFSSPVESSETESDEEDYLTGLTRQMAYSTLDDEFNFKHSNSAFASEKPKGWVASGSPQSTLYAVSSGCGCGQGSSRGSPNAQSPPATWDLLHAAAGEVAKMSMNQSRGLLDPPRKPSPVSVPINNPDAAYCFHQQSLSHKHLRAAQFKLLRQQQMMKEQSAAVWGAQTRYPPPQTQPQTHPNFQTRARNTPNILNARPVGLSPSAWPPLQQAKQQQEYNRKGSGLRAVYLGNQYPSAKIQRSGTGVFLPRQVGSESETRKKPVCSTVLLPARVVQALNLNIDDMQHPQLQRRFNGKLNSDYEVALQLRSNAAARTAISQQKRIIRPQAAVGSEIRLPQDWTY
ncbi:hypothetical protein TB1_009198 [Malus domestica]|uniref:TIP41-like protein n=1 Tax=Malus domestica TaxID=3750 RepID=A0A498IH25_MALDO|nr:hypothetical protein DVH24_006167 [Malus domestica]